MRLIYSLLLSLVLSVSFGQGAFRMAMVRSKEYVEPSLSAPSFASGGNYQTSREYYIYKPRGYDQAAAGSLPLMVFFGGYGMRTWANRVNEGEGLYYFLNNGSWDDLTYGHIVVVCEYTVGDVNPNTGHFDDILTELTAEGVKYDPNRVSMTGLSGGSIGIKDILPARYTQIASVVTICGPSLTSGWADLNGIGYWQHSGNNDSAFGESIGGTLYQANGGVGSFRDLTPAPRGSYYYFASGDTHTSAVWNNHIYNPSTAEYNFFQYAAKFNKDATLQATQFTDNAEATLDIVDYREAKMLTDNLSSGAPKTALLARISTLLTTINQSGTRYYISPQTSGLGALNTGYNIITSFTTGASISNIVDVTNGASTIDIEVTQEMSNGTRDGNASGNNAGRMKSHGFDDYRINLQGAVILNSTNNGRITLKQIPTGKLVDVFIYTHHLAANDDTAAGLGTDNVVQVICNSVTKSQYVAYNNYRGLSFLDVPESSGDITIDFDAIGTRDVLLTGIELLVHD